MSDGRENPIMQKHAWEQVNPSPHFGINANKFQLLHKYLALQKRRIHVSLLCQLSTSNLQIQTIQNYSQYHFYSTFIMPQKKCVTHASSENRKINQEFAKEIAFLFLGSKHKICNALLKQQGSEQGKRKKSRSFPSIFFLQCELRGRI